MPLNRRHLIKASAAAAVTAPLPACTDYAEGPTNIAVPGTPRPPMGPFTSESTAEEVTVGLDLAGQNILVTGCNSGIGFETMRVLALRGAHVLGTGRTAKKAAAACASVEGKTTPLVLELSDFDNVVACTEQVKALGIPLDGLICNAGIMALPELEQVSVNGQGIEKQFVVNHLGHFILATRLAQAVKASDAGRVVMLSSAAAYMWPPEQGIWFDNLSGENDYDWQWAYGQSKLANALFAREFARRLAKDSNATANSVHPGGIATNLGRHLPGYQQTLMRLIGGLFMKTIEQGAATTCYVATNPKLAGVTGYFFGDSNPTFPAGYIEDDAMAARLWGVSEEMVGAWL